MSRTTPQDLSAGDEDLAERVHEQFARGTIAHGADTVDSGAVAEAGLEHEPLILGSATCSKSGVVRGALGAAALRTSGLGGRVAAVAVRRRHDTDISPVGRGCQGAALRTFVEPGSIHSARDEARSRTARRRWA